jgi:predicted anti-sigma-YlaC factor YlaD
MTELTCDSVCEAAMAVFDGEPSELSLAAIENHLAICPTCGQEIEELKSLAIRLSQQERREQTKDLWPVISRELDQREYGAGRSPGWRTFVLLTVLLPAYRLVEIVPRVEIGTAFKLIPVLLVIGVFCYLRENPFKINPLLTLEGE